ncbi:hypothetical protein [Tropheryma whipplei]|uniref:Uncharacterized protein n=1 Tax=Tropheryma whipplei (strain Twist) TaxID=203267 RepID=Q83GV4_TROWT|nr:hypothetical protein [Tropheryma whipplei]AAO44228.1 unknown [Tropheryma whipplei str. Twist]MCO8182880.1 hypothetical protein [Tropheryma whipplei]
MEEIYNFLNNKTFAEHVKTNLGQNAFISSAKQNFCIKLETYGQNWLGGRPLQLPTCVKFVAILFRSISCIEFTNNNPRKTVSGRCISILMFLETLREHCRRCRLHTPHTIAEGVVTGVHKDHVHLKKDIDHELFFPICNLIAIELL